MKFAQYLQETQAPEWKKAYIDYRGLKKKINVIRKAEQENNILDSAPGPTTLDTSPYQNSSGHHSKSRPSIDALSVPVVNEEEENDEIQTEAYASNENIIDQSQNSMRKSFIARRKGKDKSLSSRLNNSSRSQPSRLLTSLSLRDILPELSPTELKFVAMLDDQLEKVENFYLAREKDMVTRGEMLQVQLNELHEQRRKLVHTYPKGAWTSAIASKIKLKLNKKGSADAESLGADTEAASPKSQDVNLALVGQNSHAGISSSSSQEPSDARGKENQKRIDNPSSDEDQPEDGTTKFRVIHHSSDEESYLYAKKKLKKAVQEYYRGLEVLHNYRVLNITGFRKSLKKFEKATKIRLQHAYMTEKVERSAFYSDKTVQNMMKEMETIYAATFVNGDRKKALGRLRGGQKTRSHHFSTFRTGILLGIALPPLISGIIHTFDKNTRKDIPGWDGLLFIYAVLLVPTLFSVLVGLNLLVWSHSRVNYVFIFELDLRTRMDCREYFEMPSFFFASLCYAFWLSFSRAGAPSVSPTIWPLAWLGFVAVVTLNPFPIFYKSSRYWLLKRIGKLLISGTQRVEFTDFWLGDQFCSLTFTLSNLYLFGCVYANGFDDNWRKCGTSSSHWPVAFALSILPLLIRLVQSIRRYVDSGLTTHLVNGGKYGSGIVSYLFYILWRHQGSSRGTLFVLYCLSAAYYAVYASCWDLMMDWSVLRTHAQHPLLREEIIYSNHISLYYLAIISNILIRFIWVLYLPLDGPDIQLCTFIVAFLEMLRRCQWNFYRLENEHLGNMDQYRITREVPLPYAFEDSGREDDDEYDEQHKKQR